MSEQPIDPSGDEAAPAASEQGLPLTDQFKTLETWYLSLSPEDQHRAFTFIGLGFLAAQQAVETKDEVISRLKNDNEKLHFEASHDPLTTALNRRGLEEYLRSNEESKAVAVISADANNFKAINDKFGYERGDQVIIATYNILSASTRRQDIIVRLGGDEFLVILNGLETEGEEAPPDHERRQHIASDEELLEITTSRIAKSIEELLSQEGNADLREVDFGLAVGGLIRPSGSSFSDLVRKAEEAMKANKDEFHEERGSYR